MGETGRQMMREGGPDFREFRQLPGLVLLEDTQVFSLMGEVAATIQKGTIMVVEKQ
jgi:hypothetical protein